MDVDDFNCIIKVLMEDIHEDEDLIQTISGHIEEESFIKDSGFK